MKRLVVLPVLLAAAWPSPVLAAWSGAREPFLQNAAKDTAAIYWDAGTAGGTQTLSWGQGATLNQTATGVLMAGTTQTYKAVLTGLTPSTSYSWQVTSNADTSSIGSFVTAPPDGSQSPFRFGVFGDDRTDDTNHAAVVAQMKTYSPEFIVNTGDLTDLGTYTTFFSLEKALLYQAAIFPALGNHDVVTTYQTAFDRPNYYAFRWGNAKFVAVSACGTDSYTSMTDPQIVWLNNELAADRADSTIEWLIVYHHYPVYSSDSTHGSTTDEWPTLRTLYNQYNVDVVFNGHSHTYERIVADNRTYFVTGGGGAPLYSIGTPVTGSQAAKSTYNVVVGDVNGGSLTLTAYDTSGNQLDQTVINKGASPPGSPTPTPTATPGGGGGNGAGGEETIHGGCACDLSSVDGEAAGVAGAAVALGAGLLAFIRRRKI